MIEFIKYNYIQISLFIIIVVIALVYERKSRGG